ncbi:Glycogen synthase [bacterium HR15]|nr:Glycogen synthase [bacterium HR15]
MIIHPMRILFAAAEMTPLAKVGGLADVAGALPKALNARGHDVRVILPAYPMILNHPRWHAEPLLELTVPIHTGWQERALVYQIRLPQLTAYLIHSHWFDGATESTRIYSVEPRAYIFFCRAVAAFIERYAESWQPQIVHCNDWHTALIPVYLRMLSHPVFESIGTVFTIHNLAYQGIFEAELFSQMGLPDHLFATDGLEFYGKVNFMKGGLLFSDQVNTVSPTYAREIQTPEYGERLEELLRTLAEQHRLSGILNGIDYEEWNPETDPHIPAPYNADDLSGKSLCKRALQQACGWHPESDRAVIGLVSRLTDQKGLDLIKAISAKILQLPVQLVLLGTGDADYERFFRLLHKRHRAKVHATIGFDNAWAHQIYAGADMFLMPSRFEPCGLGQLISLRYGTIPIVRHTGGLADTITDYDLTNGAGNGFAFRDYKPAALYDAVERAVNLFGDQARWQALMRHAMRQDWSWRRSAQEYEALYRRVASSESPVASGILGE